MKKTKGHFWWPSTRPPIKLGTSCLAVRLSQDPERRLWGHRFFFSSLFSICKMNVLLAFFSPTFWIARDKNPRQILDARKNTRFAEFFVAHKTLWQGLKFPRIKNARIRNVFCSKWRNKQFFICNFKKYSHGFTRTWDIYSQGFLLP